MRKIFPILILFLGFAIAQDVLDTPGPHTFWSGDTLKKDSTKTSADYLYTTNYTKLHVWIKSTNPVDSTKYRLYYVTAFGLTDILAVPSDSAANESGNTIIQVNDTLWHYRAITIAPQYNKLVLKSLTGQGNRCRTWVKVYMTKE